LSAGALAGLSLGIGGCGSLGKGPRGGTPSLSKQQHEQALMLLRKLKMEHSLHRDRQVLELADELRADYPGFSATDEALLVALRSARRLQAYDEGAELLADLRREHGGSPLLTEALAAGADLQIAAGDSVVAVDLLVARHGRLPDAAGRVASRQALVALLDDLALPTLAICFEQQLRGDLAGPIGLVYAQRLVAAGRYAAAEEVSDRLQAAVVDTSTLEALAALLAAGPTAIEGAPGRLPAGVPQTNQVGILCPLTGRYAVLGNAFYDGALLALESTPAFVERGYELKVEDTAGDPVTAALAARRLCREAGSVCIIGGLMSAPTASAAVVADAFGVPLISPTATNDRIWQLGPGVFQTNLTGLFEARLLAQLATGVLLKKRYAVLYPNTAEGERHYRNFAEEVVLGGGEVVGVAHFPTEATDFRESILEIKLARPEVIFVPASVDQMVLLGPQLDFYMVGAVILGPSSWNSPRLLQRAGAVLERAVFPSDNALFPAEWTDDFFGRWSGMQYPDEATPLALRAYQTTRLVFDILERTELERRYQLTEALERRLASREVETEGPESFASMVRMFRGEQIVAFPASLYTEAWRVDLARAAAADTLPGGFVESADLPAPGGLTD